MQDFIVTHTMRQCDVLISLTGSYVKAVKKAKKDNSIIIMERGSKHILEQKRIMEEICGADAIPQFNVDRELCGYELADYISIASMHVERSFLQHGFLKNKLFRNPYGTDLSMFTPLLNVKKEYDVIMVGGWSKRKGCDILTEALRDTNYKFLHVGGLADMEFPKLPNFTHVDSVDQRELINYYNKAKTFALVSREDGFGMVLSQAMACGLPLICTKDTGGEDLREFLEEDSRKFIIVLENITAEKIRTAVADALDLVIELPVNSDYMGSTKENLSWVAYGQRYARFIDKIVVDGFDMGYIRGKDYEVEE
ncbi:MAG: glycosyltransferase family 4 protein [Oscillospiraceae bacterium]|nr:glycosyltransferase family 4 protein [Oscillospiraceae bacterium]